MLHYQRDASRLNGKSKEEHWQNSFESKVDSFVCMYQTEVKKKRNRKVVTDQNLWLSCQKM